MTEFPVLDAPRLYANNSLGRCVFASFDYVEPYLEETDAWVALPLRLVHDQGAGWHIELGPYSLGATDVHRLREAIAAYDRATGESES
ncbi:hypothetical protein MMAN_58030 [Mycobacterium mantenii]|uniref:Uncharacterized protein n=1 Tax=Mycobacterium mantenii TaxID=560555 RepID=A0A1X0G4H4_MYCNT|nr:hypothetical protein [Mycobacterium mantenii]MCV7243825.1 hypothetical protein [Mycobacterium mantenii]ORB08725.1 hypothetical protein BST30_01940 [Mycobacterium mantenii]BBY35887.1 hypothetical protein MMAN_00210 [Mycobacterium mantenii]BBY41669.1 hypothetical protein MMAN_58030 [Mycobacterium mantenii]